MCPNISATASGLEKNQLYNKNELTNSEKAESITNPHSCIEDGPRINGKVTNISAGGFGLVVGSDYPHEITNWLTDPQCKGPFPLGGIVCQLIGEQKGERKLEKCNRSIFQSKGKSLRCAN